MIHLHGLSSKQHTLHLGPIGGLQDLQDDGLGQSQDKRPEWPYAMMVFYTLVEDLSEDEEMYKHWGEMGDISLKDL